MDEKLSLYLQDDTPSHLISLRRFRNLQHFISVPDDLVLKVITNLKSKGYRDNIYTYQEHQIFGSTMNEYSDEPYIPIGFLAGELSLSEIAKARSLEKIFEATGYYFNNCALFVTASLEPLDSIGRTIRDPILLNDSLYPISFEYSKNFPCRRE